MGAVVRGCHTLHMYEREAQASRCGLLTPRQDNDTWAGFLLAGLLTLASSYILKPMIPGGTCENGITVLFSAAGFLHIWKVVMRSLPKSGLVGITVCVFPILLFRFLYSFTLSSMACLYANMPNVPSPFMRGADFLVANVMLSSILPARHRAVKLFQSTEVNASKAWYCGGRSL